VKARAIVALAALLAMSFPAVAVADVIVEPSSGTSFESRPSSEGQTYMCLGAGVRKYLFWKVYAMDFCVEESRARAEIDTYFAGPGQRYASLRGDALAEALRHDERFFGAMSSMRADKRAEMVFLRDASADTLRKSFVKNLQKSFGSGDAEAAMIGDFVSPIDHDVKAGNRAIFVTHPEGELVFAFGAKSRSLKRARVDAAFWTAYLGPDSPIGSLRDAVARGVANLRR
jgi:hypothetical protein